jgi:hypothetical protein
MTILINFGDKFKLAPTITPDGSMILANTIPMPMLERSKFNNYPHMRIRYFDPQLYMTQLDPNQSGKYCSTLASYPWFGAKGIKKYKTGLQKRAEWRKEINQSITSLWPQMPLSPNTDAKLISDAIRDCVDFQLRIGCRAIILPSPLTFDPYSDYQDEIFWLDTGLQYISRLPGFDKPVFATIALSDNCIRFSSPGANSLLNLILDTISARKINGAYLVIEQGGEPEFARQLSNTNSLWSALNITHILKHECKLQVGVNFFGAFGLVLEAAGADFWATGWYKSRYRFRLADKLGGGRAYPLYWSQPAAIDIHLKSDIKKNKINDFDKLANANILGGIAQKTPASSNLLFAVSQGASSDDVLEWKYGPGRIYAAAEHYFYSVIQADKDLSKIPVPDRLDYIENSWLAPATNNVKEVLKILGSNGDTRLGHVQAWLDALRRFREDQNI